MWQDLTCGLPTAKSQVTGKAIYRKSNEHYRNLYIRLNRFSEKFSTELCGVPFANKRNSMRRGEYVFGNFWDQNSDLLLSCEGFDRKPPPTRLV
jgi:hypothetical protein